MSADGHGFCPVCVRDRALDQFDMEMPEYYEVGFLHDGRFIVDFYCECRDCGYTYSYKYETRPELLSNEPTHYDG